MSEHRPIQNQDVISATHRSGVINVPGRINAAVYTSIKKYITMPAFKVVLIALFVGYNLWLLYQLFLTKNLAYLLFMALYSALMIFVHLHGENSQVKRIIKSRKELQGDGFDVLLTFGPDNIKLINHTLGSERTILYSDLRSSVETDKCIAYFTTKNNYLMVPKNNMDEALREKLLAFMQAKCPSLKKRW